jgi:hypothetical protein
VIETRVKLWCIAAGLTLATGGVAYARLPAESPRNPPRPQPVQLQAPQLSPQRQRDLSV